MLLLQELVQGMLSKFNLLEGFLDLGTHEMKCEFIRGENSLLVSRSKNVVTLIAKEPYFVFEFKVYPGTPKFGEVGCHVGEMRYPVMIDDNGPAFSCKGYSQFKEYANELSHKLEIEDWLNEAKLVDTLEPAPVKSEVGMLAEIESFSRFQRIIHKILVKHDLIDAFYDSSCESVYLKLQQECYMDLVIERQHHTVFVGHYRKQNGDLISDPVLVFQLSEGVRTWAPYRIEQVFGDTQIMLEREGKTLISPKRLKAFKSFANMFAGNIRDQGWMEADVADKRCYPEESEEDELPILVIAPEVIIDNAGQMAFGF